MNLKSKRKIQYILISSSAKLSQPVNDPFDNPTPPQYAVSEPPKSTQKHNLANHSAQTQPEPNSQVPQSPQVVAQQPHPQQSQPVPTQQYQGYPSLQQPQQSPYPQHAPYPQQSPYQQPHQPQYVNGVCSLKYMKSNILGTNLYCLSGISFIYYFNCRTNLLLLLLNTTTPNQCMLFPE